MTVFVTIKTAHFSSQIWITPVHYRHKTPSPPPPPPSPAATKVDLRNVELTACRVLTTRSPNLLTSSQFGVVVARVTDLLWVSLFQAPR